jgi:hypothetical protein
MTLGYPNMIAMHGFEGLDYTSRGINITRGILTTLFIKISERCAKNFD